MTLPRFSRHLAPRYQAPGKRGKAALYGMWMALCAGYSGVYADASPPTVTVQPLPSLLRHPPREAPAHVVSLNDTPLSLPVAGTVAEVPVLVGQKVNKGDLLIRLDPWEYENRVRQAQATLEETRFRLQLAQRQQERTVRLRKEGRAPEEQLEQRQTERQSLAARIKQQEAARQMAEERLAKSRLVAPFSGVVVERTAQIGLWSTPGVPLLRLVNQDRLELVAYIRPDQRDHFNARWRGFFQQNGRAYPVRLRAVVALQDARTHTQEARFVFVKSTPSPLQKGLPEGPQEKNHGPIPGATGRLVWQDPRPHVPANLLVKRQGVLGLFMVDGKVARFHALSQALEGQSVPLSSPLISPLDGMVVVAGREGLTDGAAIDSVAATSTATPTEVTVQLPGQNLGGSAPKPPPGRMIPPEPPQ